MFKAELWNPDEWAMGWEQWRSPELLVWLFNNAPNEKDLVITTPEFNTNIVKTPYAYVFRIHNIEPNDRGS